MVQWQSIQNLTKSCEYTFPPPPPPHTHTHTDQSLLAFKKTEKESEVFSLKIGTRFVVSN